MSKHVSSRRKTIPDIQNMKGHKPVVVLTAYTAPLARILDEHVDLLLVGDSLGMVLYDMDSTLPVSLDMMIDHGKAVVKSSKSACVVVDMPFGSYQGGTETAFNSAARMIKESGCQGVKVEGGAEMAETITFLTRRGIPVMGHVALMPQYVHAMGGYRYQGRTPKERKKIMEDALAVEKAGAFSIVLEGVEESLAREITTRLAIPTIGIGASPQCDGQVLVTEDMFGMTAKAPGFVKQYVDVGSMMEKAAAQYADEVRNRKFPTATHCFYNKK